MRCELTWDRLTQYGDRDSSEKADFQRSQLEGYQCDVALCLNRDNL